MIVKQNVKDKMQSDAEYYGLDKEASKIWLIIPS